MFFTTTAAVTRAALDTAIAAASHKLQTVETHSVSNSELTSALSDLDLRLRLRVTESMVETLTHQPLSEPMRLVFESLPESVNNIHAVFERIHLKQQKQAEKYFSEWRGEDYTIELQTLRKLKTKLEERFALLVTLMQCDRLQGYR